MPPKVSTDRRRPEVNSLDLPLIGVAPAAARAANSQSAVNSVDGAWILSVLADALDRTMPRKEAAYAMGMDAGQLSRQLAGDGHLSVRRLGALGDAYWRNVIQALQVEFGILSKAELIAQAESLADRARQLFAKAASL
ncbi:MAG: hypothetical protein AB7I13_01785 [Vicinamibacterales bacterium]